MSEQGLRLCLKGEIGHCRNSIDHEMMRFFMGIGMRP